MRQYFCKVYEDPYRLQIKIGLFYSQGKELFVLVGDEWKKIEDKYHDIEQWTIVLPRFCSAEGKEILVSLVDGLISMGMKPTKPVDNPSELNATKYHLEDMRQIALKRKK